MKVILLQDVKNLGKQGDVIDAKDGYARNFLIPNGKAKEATNENIKLMKEKKASEKHREEVLFQEAKVLKAELEKLTVCIYSKSGENGKLFGSITGKDVADQLKAQHQIDLDKRKIKIDGGNIKAIGLSTVQIKLHTKVQADLKVEIKEEI